MKIIEVNHKTAASLLKKSVVEHWLADKDAYLKFTDGSVVCFHVLDPKWETYVSVQMMDNTTNRLSFTDDSDTHLWFPKDGGEHLFVTRIVSLYFDNACYYINDKLRYATRQYAPIIEFYYYEPGEDIANHNS